VVQSLAWHGGRALAWSLPRFLPRNDTIVFGSDRVDDPDALVILDYLAEHSSRPLRWTARTQPITQLLNPLTQATVVAAREGSFTSLITYGQSPIVFHTAGLYTSPEPARGRTVVTVWHGDGPKSTSPPRIRGTYMVTGVEYFGRRRIQVHGYPETNLLITGRPRVDDLYRGIHDRESGSVDSQRDLEKLGLDGRPVIWWLPTWRQDSAGKPVALEAANIDALQLNPDLMARYQFIVKPHPLAVQLQWPKGWRVLTDADLYRNQIRLYRMLGLAHCVLTDYSSVWSDFLGTQIPVGFVLTDMKSFADARGFYDSDWHTKLPGPILQTQFEFIQFTEQGWTEELAIRRREVSTEIGAINEFGATKRLFEALDEKGVPWR